MKVHLDNGNVCMCKLDDGRIVEYDCTDMHEASDYYTPDKWMFIGTGIIHSVNGVLQSYDKDDKRWFYVRLSKVVQG